MSLYLGPELLEFWRKEQAKRLADTLFYEENYKPLLQCKKCKVEYTPNWEEIVRSGNMAAGHYKFPRIAHSKSHQKLLDNILNRLEKRES